MYMCLLVDITTPIRVTDPAHFPAGGALALVMRADYLSQVSQRFTAAVIQVYRVP